MYKKIVTLIMILTLTCSGCNLSDNAVVHNNQINYVNSKYLKKELFIENDELNCPMDIVCTEQAIYVVNQGNNNILVFNYEGKLLETFGNYGQGESEFTNPQAIALNDDNIYVVEKESCRIQVFDRNFTFVKEIILDTLKNTFGVSAFDLEVDQQGNIYLTVEGIEPKLLKVYKIKTNGKIEKIGSKLIGVMDRSADDKIYFTPTYEFFENKHELGYRSGLSYVGTMDNSLDKMFDLTNKYTPTSIAVSKDRIYLFSNYMKQIDEFLFDGGYVRTLYREEPTDDNFGMTHMDMFKDSFYMTDSENNVIYIFKPQGD